MTLHCKFTDGVMEQYTSENFNVTVSLPESITQKLPNNIVSM